MTYKSQFLSLFNRRRRVRTGGESLTCYHRRIYPNTSTGAKSIDGICSPLYTSDARVSISVDHHCNCLITAQQRFDSKDNITCYNLQFIYKKVPQPFIVIIFSVDLRRKQRISYKINDYFSSFDGSFLPCINLWDPCKALKSKS